MDLARAGRRNDQDLADARYCHSAAEPRPAGRSEDRPDTSLPGTRDEIRGNLGNPLAQSC
jgi:hypothetical protein